MNEHAHILIVDDDEQVLGFMVRILTRDGFVVTSTHSGVEGIEFAARTSPDLMILDLSMPNLDGFEIMRKLQSAAPAVKVIAVSGSMQGVLLNSARIFGAAATLEKPVDPDLLIQTITRVLGDERAIGAG